VAPCPRVTKDLGRVSAVRPGIHGKAGALLPGDPSNVGLGDGHFQDHPLQLFGEDKELGSGKTGGDGLAGLDAAGEDDAINGRFYHCFFQIIFIDAELGFRRAGIRLGTEEIRLRAGSPGDGGIQFGRGGHAPSADPVELLLAEKGGLTFSEGRLGLTGFCHRGSHGGAAAGRQLGQLAGVQPGECLAFGDAVIDVRIDFQGDAGEFTADRDFIGRLQGSGGSDDEVNVPPVEDRGDVSRSGIAGRLGAAPPEPPTPAGRKQ